MLMKVLFLYGVNCDATVWEALLPLLSTWDCNVLCYPHDVTLHANTVDDIAQWVEGEIKGNHYDAVIGHSLGGLVALSLALKGHVSVGRVICLDTNLCPAGTFYRNLMTGAHMEQYGAQVKAMMAAESKFYTPELIRSLQENFDYTPLLNNIACPVTLLMGDRNTKNAQAHLPELNLPDFAYQRMEIRFVPDACHMQMIENPKALAEILTDICR